METKHKTSMRLSPDAKQLVTALAATLGISQAAVMELALRAYATRQGLTAPQPERNPDA